MRTRPSTWTRERVLLLLPAVALLSVVLLLPIARVANLSLSRTEFDGGPTNRWTGLEQYARLWQDERWGQTLRNTLVFTGGSVAAETIVGIAFALVLHRSFRGRGLVRALVVMPWTLPTAVMALAWAWIFNDAFGVANDLLLRAGIIARPVAWLGEPGTAMASMIVADVWKTTPFVMLIVLAGLQGIPEPLIEAAKLDGLSGWSRFRRIVLPLVSPAIVVAVAYRMVQAWGAFDIVWVMTGGGPAGATETISLYAFLNYFRYLDFGYGAAIATQGVLLAALLVFLLIRLAGGRR